MRVDAFLRDSATVREGLLHVLGGGITRLWRNRYPADLNVALAMMIAMSPTEANNDHVLQATVSGTDGEPIAQLDGQFRSEASEYKVPGEASTCRSSFHSTECPCRAKANVRSMS